MFRVLLITFILFPGITSAVEGYKNKAIVDSVPAKGFYKISLSPEMISYIKSDYSDIRLVNSKHQEIPYLFIKEAGTNYKSYFRELDIIENVPLFTPKLSRIIIANAEKKKFTGFLFVIRNTAVEPEVTIKGSDDKQNWFFISRGNLEKYGTTDSDTSEIRSIQFPKNNYTYFEISITHKKGEAMQFIKAGYSDSKLSKGLYSQVPSPQIFQKDSLKKSFITIVFNRPYELDRIEFEITGPDYYLRNCNLGQYVKQRKQSAYFEPRYAHTLTSNKANYWEFENLKADTIHLEIENEDNAPIKISAIRAFQLNKYLIAQLNKDEIYEVYLNNAQATSPNYDLKYFTEVIPSNLSVLGLSSVKNLSEGQILQPKANFFNKQMVWIVIIIVVIALGAISIKLVKELKDHKT